LHLKSVNIYGISELTITSRVIASVKSHFAEEGKFLPIGLPAKALKLSNNHKYQYFSTFFIWHGL